MKPRPERAPRCTYEEAVAWLREQDEYRDLVVAAYLDRDNRAAAERFERSPEFTETCHLLEIPGRGARSLLEVGGGNGIAAFAFSRKGISVVSTDVDSSGDVGLRAAARLEEKGGPGQIRVVLGRAEALPCRDGAFDRVYARQALHHLQDLEGGLRECGRVLRRGGLFLAAREHVVSDDEQLRRFLEKHPLQPLHGGETAYPVAEYEAAIRAAGLAMISILGPYDSPVNQHPTPDEEVRSWMREGLRRRVGSAAAGLLVRVPGLLSAYKRRLSRICQYPGRLFSFLCRKP